MKNEGFVQVEIKEKELLRSKIFTHTFPVVFLKIFAKLFPNIPVGVLLRTFAELKKKFYEIFS